MAEASEALRTAQARNEQAMGVLRDTEGTADGLLILRREGHAYAQALTRATAATIDWLRYVDTILRSKDLALEVESGK